MYSTSLSLPVKEAQSMASKKLTAQEVANKRFTPVRMREGYSIDEVDEFLEAVESTINAYNDEETILEKSIDELKNKPAPVASNPKELADVKERLESTLRELAEAQAAGSPLESTVQELNEELAKAKAATETANQGRLAAEAARDAAVELAAQSQADSNKPMDIASASGAVARMLETAAKNYEELVAAGEAEANKAREDASSAAATILSQAEAAAATKLAEITEQANAALEEANKAKREAFESIEAQKRGLEEAVESLKAIETHAREELIRVYSTRLQEVQDTPLVTGGVPTTTGSRRQVENHGTAAFVDVPSFNG